jgi:predicted Zn finger-like uncharacterized protein
MKITCHSCGAKYTVSDEKVQGKTVKMKCRKCGTTIVVGAQGAIPDAGGAAADSGLESSAAVDAPAAGSYLVNVSEGDQRTMSLDELVEAHRQGVVTNDTYLWADGMSEWQALSENATVVAALSASAPAPAVSARREAAAPAPDLFGPMAAEPSAVTWGGIAAPSAPVAKRDENSVLFSLSALTSTTNSIPAPKPSQTTAKKDDSGLIDLKALAASASTTSAAVELPATPSFDSLGVFPLGAPPMPVQAAPPPVFVAPPPAPKSNNAKFAIMGVAVVGLMVGVFFVARMTAAPPPAPSAAQVTVPPTAEPAPTVAAAPTTAPVDPVPTSAPLADASAAASASAAPAAGKPVSGPRTFTGGSKPATTPPASTAKPPTTSASTPAKPPAGGGKGSCGCAPSDLMCAMKCSAGKK